MPKLSSDTALSEDMNYGRRHPESPHLSPSIKTVEALDLSTLMLIW